MTVAGDLVFFADGNGILYAASAATGEILWVFDALTVPGAGGANSPVQPFMRLAASSMSRWNWAATAWICQLVVLYGLG